MWKQNLRKLLLWKETASLLLQRAAERGTAAASAAWRTARRRHDLTTPNTANQTQKTFIKTKRRYGKKKEQILLSYVNINVHVIIKMVFALCENLCFMTMGNKKCLLAIPPSVTLRSQYIVCYEHYIIIHSRQENMSVFPRHEPDHCTLHLIMALMKTVKRLKHIQIRSTHINTI